METSLRTQTALEIAQWASVASRSVRAPPRLLFEGGVYFAQSSWLCGYYSRAATIRRQHLIEEVRYVCYTHTDIDVLYLIQDSITAE